MKLFPYVPALCLLLLSCKRNSCETVAYPRYPQSYFIGLDYVSSNNQPLITSTSSLFVQNEVAVKDDQNRLVPFEFELIQSESGSQRSFYRLNIAAFQSAEEEKGCRRIYLFLKNDIDTLDYCYKMDKCKMGFENIEAAYNKHNINFSYNGNFIATIEK